MTDPWLPTPRRRSAICHAMSVLAACRQGYQPQETEEAASADSDGQIPIGTTLEHAGQPEEVEVVVDGRKVWRTG